MPPRARIPHELRTRPFTLEEARAAGLSASSLKGRQWRRLGARLYCWTALTPDNLAVIAAWRRSLPEDAVFAGRTAAWLHGLELEAANPIEVAVPRRSELRPREGASVWRCEIDSQDIEMVRGIRATTLRRTLLDLCARRPAVEG